MFPVTITLTTADQLNAVMSALGNTVKAPVPEKKSEPNSPPPVAKEEPKAAPVAATESVATATTAEVSAAPATKAEVSEPAIIDKDALATATKAAIAKVGRDAVVELIKSYGAAKGSEIATEKRAEFDAKLLALAA